MAEQGFSSRKRGAMTTTYGDIQYKITVYKVLLDNINNAASDTALSSFAGPSKAAAAELRRLIGMYNNQWSSWKTMIKDDAEDNNVSTQSIEAYFADDGNGNSNRSEDVEFVLEQLASQLDGAVMAKSQEFLLCSQLRVTQLQTAASNNAVVPQAPVLNPPVGNNTQHTTSSPVLSSLPSFNGQAWQWPAFWSGFDATINKNTSLNDLQKFHHLYDCITGDAMAAITGLQVTSDNYTIALMILKARFDNPMQSQVELVQMILSSNSGSTSSTDQLQLIYRIRPLIIQLEKVDAHADGASMQLLLLAKFDQETQKKTIQHIDGKKLKTEAILDYIEKLLLQEVTVGDTLARINANAHQPSLSSRPTNPVLNNSSFSAQKPSGLQQRANTGSPTCVNCGNHPFSSDCQAVTTIEQRKKIIFDKHLCFKCLRSGHMAADCHSNCKQCRGLHHVSLCDGNNRGGAAPNGNNHQHVLNQQHHQKHHGLYSATMDTQQGFARLWTGSCLVKNKDSGIIQEVDFMLDSGAQLTVISTSLAEQLKLPVVGKKYASIKGPRGVSIASKYFNNHEWQLKTTTGWMSFTGLAMDDPIIVSAPCPPLSEADTDFLINKGITLTHAPSRSHNYRPKILLGAAYMLSILNNPSLISKLPSGLSLISTSLGNIVTGEDSSNDSFAFMSCLTTDPFRYHVTVLEEEEIPRKNRRKKVSFDLPPEIEPVLSQLAPIITNSSGSTDNSTDSLQQDPDLFSRQMATFISDYSIGSGTHQKLRIPDIQREKYMNMYMDYINYRKPIHVPAMKDKKEEPQEPSILDLPSDNKSIFTPPVLTSANSTEFKEPSHLVGQPLIPQRPFMYEDHNESLYGTHTSDPPSNVMERADLLNSLKTSSMFSPSPSRAC